jgi:hypothetical protein
VILDVNTKKYQQVFRPQGVDSYEFITPLPQWITMPENDGILLFHPTNTPADSTGIDRETFIYKIYLEDGTSFTQNIYTAVLGDYDIEALPADDPVLLYRLQVGTQCLFTRPYPQMMSRPNAWPCGTGSCNFYTCSTTSEKLCLCQGQ